jgi:hypothetical protein
MAAIIFWGVMCSGHICSYPSLEAGIAAIDAFLSKAESSGRDTVEKLNCWYVQPCSTNWLNTVSRTKNQLEAL